VISIIATLGENLSGLSAGIRCHIRAGCKHICISVPPAGFENVDKRVDELRREIAMEHGDITIEVLEAEYANKRMQLKLAIEKVRDCRKVHKVLLFADDDITYGEHTLRWILAPFEKASVGAVGTCQRTRRIESGPLIERNVDWIFADYIERRNFECSATLSIDGSISCLSGRVVAFRAKIVEDRQFLAGFVSETWNGMELNADDDNFATRWLQGKGWEIGFQYDEQCQVETVFEPNVRQLWTRNERWTRSNWRSNWVSVCKGRNWR
jgi:cellulose synthase/poly-beta-1,6-N-acetylglucosamine synthase-like glycosyltransferase